MVATMPGKFLARAQSFANAAIVASMVFVTTASAIPPVISVDEDSSGTVEIFEASEVPLG